MASLRARLIAVLLIVAAVGMLALAGITYTEQRSFQYSRVDQEAKAAVAVMDHRLSGDRGLGEPPRGGGPPPGDVNLPPGTYGELRDASGAVIAGPQVIGYGETPPAAPKLPAELPLDRPVTVPSVNGDDLHYRVLAESERGGSATIVVAVPLSGADATLDRLLVVEALVMAGVLLLLGAVGTWLVRLGLRPLDRMATTAGIIAAGDLSRRISPATPRTEVGRLGLALNAMLGRLEDAFAKRQQSEDRLRRFLSDASHELRTPLTAIRGYAELHRMGAASDPADVEKAMRRIEDEAARMGVLVEDLLALARLDEQREPVRRRVDVAAIARDAVDDARATAPERSFELGAEPGTYVLADAHQLRQVLANLLRNAIVHTPAGTPVEVTVARVADDVRVDVRDHGPGLPTADAEALFDRFWRAEGGRERGRAGAGLGLAIVAGIVAAHHGRVEASDAPGGGARFTVLMPAATFRPPPVDTIPQSRPMNDDAIDEFRIEEGRRNGVLVLRLRGDLDLASADTVAERLDVLSTAGEPVLLDLDSLAFMDSSGLRVVLQAAETSRTSGWRFTLTPGSEQVRNLFASAGVTDRLPIEPER
ncbi:MAG TPA: anti-sigma factor antagonist [Solirubrobacteraceae bacterium]|nr:anti-sigma factor antagonist [Solirubrobacteraceae bacterium]